MILTLISWSSNDAYANVFIPTTDLSKIVPDTFVQLKNWFKDFDVYETIPMVLSSYVKYSSPGQSNPTVESTVITVDPEDTRSITWVLGYTENSPYIAPLTPMSLLYPASNLRL